MTVKMMGAEFKRFYADPSVWGEATFHEDYEILVDGVNSIQADIDLSTVSDVALVEIKSGEIVEGLPGVPCDLLAAVVWWRSRQVSVQYVVTVSKDRMAAFESALSEIGLHSELVLLN